MATITRKTTTYRWICTNKDLCEQIDDQIASYVATLGQLSRMVADKKLDGLLCLRGEAKLNQRIKDLRDARKSLWRRVPVVKEEVEHIDTPLAADHKPETGKAEPYVSKYPTPPTGS